jgi:hypothetical protein
MVSDSERRWLFTVSYRLSFQRSYVHRLAVSYYHSINHRYRNELPIPVSKIFITISPSLSDCLLIWSSHLQQFWEIISTTTTITTFTNNNNQLVNYIKLVTNAGSHRKLVTRSLRHCQRLWDQNIYCPVRNVHYLALYPVPVEFNENPCKLFI